MRTRVLTTTISFNLVNMNSYKVYVHKGLNVHICYTYEVYVHRNIIELYKKYL